MTRLTVEANAQQAGGDAYVAHVHEVVPTVLGLREEGDDFHFLDVPPAREVHLDHMPALEEHLDLPNWLADNEPRLYPLLYAADPATAAALDAVTSAIADLDLLEITKQLDRLRRDLTDDRPAAIGHAKELVESPARRYSDRPVRVPVPSCPPW